MEIGNRIKNARSNANITQENAAEALGVSRQTVSNWENGKTYPDIVSVIKMSELYSVTLDHLLKEEKTMEQNYLEYLEESTNVVKSKDKLSKLILVLSYLGIWAVSLIVFWVMVSGSDAMGYSVLFQWIALPISTFVVTLIIAKRDYYEKKKWFAVIIMGIMFTFHGLGTFDAANMIATKTIVWPSAPYGIFGCIAALFGLGIGTLARYISKRKRANKV